MSFFLNKRNFTRQYAEFYLNPGEGEGQFFIGAGGGGKKEKEPNAGDCHCHLSAAPKGGRGGEVQRWDHRVSHPRVLLLKGQWGMGQRPTGITQLLCELTFPTPRLFSPIPAMSFHSTFLFGKSGLFPWKMYMLKLLEAVL